jgi:membrane-associated protease RseP (regulator of RpoE activity)
MQTLTLSSAFVRPSNGRVFMPTGKGTATTGLSPNTDVQKTTRTTNERNSATALSMAPLASVVSSIASPLASIACLAGVIVVHEGGHYLAARSFNISVDEFSVGVGPKLFGFATKQNEFNVRAIPFGGYVRFPENYNISLARQLDEEAFLADMERKEKLQANINMTLASKTLDVLTFGAVSRSKENQEEERLQQLQKEKEASRSWFQKTFKKKDSSSDVIATITASKEVEIDYYDDPDLLQNRPWTQRAVVLMGGIIFNIALAFACYFGEITIGDGLQKPVFDQGAIIRSINRPDAASTGLLKPGDVIMGINGVPLSTSDPDGVSSAQRSISSLVSTIRATPQGDSVELEVRHPGAKAGTKADIITIQPKSSLDPGTGRAGPQSIGVTLGPNYVRTEVVHAQNVGEAATLAGKAVFDLTSETARSLLNLFSQIGSKNGGGVTSQMTGPIGLINTGSEVVKTNDSGALIAFIAAVSINLAVINSVPLPALDGGQLVFVLAEAVIGRKVNQKFQEGITAATVVFLLFISLSTSFEDIFKIFGK